MSFRINKKYTLICIISSLIVGFFTDIPFVSYAWYLFFFFGIAGLLLLIIWFQICKKFNLNRLMEAIGVTLLVLGYIFFISILQTIELNNKGIETDGIIQNFVRSRRDKTKGTYSVIFTNKKNIKYQSTKSGRNGIYRIGDTVSVLYSERIPEINRVN